MGVVCVVVVAARVWCGSCCMDVVYVVVRALDALNLNMEHKARNFESPYLAALFLLNNFHFVHKTFSQ